MLAKKVGGPAQLVAPKRRAEAEGLGDAELFAWLAADGNRLRRPIIDIGGEISLGFAASAREEVKGRL